PCPPPCPKVRNKKKKGKQQKKINQPPRHMKHKEAAGPQHEQHQRDNHEHFCLRWRKRRDQNLLLSHSSFIERAAASAHRHYAVYLWLCRGSFCCGKTPSFRSLRAGNWYLLGG